MSDSTQVSTTSLETGMVNLTILFVYLKLTHQIDWSWWEVTAPLWLPLGIGTAIIVFVASIHLLSKALSEG